MIFNLSDFNSHWQTKKLEQLGTFKRGKSKHRPRNDEKLFENGIYPLIQTGEVKESSLFIDKHTQTYNEFGLKQSKLWDKNTLCITIAANIAETAILKYPMCFPDSIVGFNAYENESSELFMHYVFTYIKKSIQNSASGSIQDNINIDYLTKLKFKIPEKNYQDKIVDILYSLDSKIELNNKINKELEAMAKTLYDYWFVQFEFPDENGKPYKSSGGKMVYNLELKREIPERWEVEKLNRFLDIDTGYSFQSSSYLEDGKYKIITIKNVKQGMLNTDKVDYINDIPERIKTTSILNLGDILISLTGDVARVCFVNEENTLLNQRVGHIFSIDDEISDSLIYFLMKSDHIYNKAVDIATGSNQKNLSGIDLLNLKIPFSRKIINNFSNKVQPIFEKMINIQKQNQELAKLRDWLLPMLMNGQVKVEI